MFSFLRLPTIDRPVKSRMDDDAGWNDSRSMGLSDLMRMLNKSKAGERVTDKSALMLAPYWAGCRIITESQSLVPAQIRRREDLPDKEVDKVTVQRDHRIHKIFNSKANPKMSSGVFRRYMTLSVINWGASFAEKQFDMMGDVVALWPIHPSRVKRYIRVEEGDQHPYPEGDLMFEIRNEGQPSTWLHESEMYWQTGPLSEDGVVGKSTIQYMASTLGIAQAQDKHVGGFFRNGASPDIVIKAPSTPNKEKRQELRESWQENYGGSENAHKSLFLWGNMEATPISINPKDAQLIETREFSVVEIARALKINPRLLGATRTSQEKMEDETKDLALHTISPWCLFESEAITTHLLTDDEVDQGYEVHHRIQDLHRFDLNSLSEHILRMFGVGIFNIDEGREMLGLNPVTNGDKRFIANNNLVPLDIAVDPSFYKKSVDAPSGNGPNN